MIAALIIVMVVAMGMAIAWWPGDDARLDSAWWMTEGELLARISACEVAGENASEYCKELASR